VGTAGCRREREDRCDGALSVGGVLEHRVAGSGKMPGNGSAGVKREGFNDETAKTYGPKGCEVAHG